MKTLEAQISNYMDWLSERGIGSLPQYHKSEPRSRSRLAILFEGSLSLAEKAMLERIVTALGEKEYIAQPFTSSQSHDLFAILSCTCIIVLGELEIEPSLSLTRKVEENSVCFIGKQLMLLRIPRPQLMLDQPALKIAAWSVLKEAKSFLAKDTAPN